MKPEMSEFSYGYAYTSELVPSLGSSVIAAPEFPSLQQEGKPGGGYDVKIDHGYPLFLQFKLSHHLARTNSKEYPLMGGAYYRWHMHARRHSSQHDLLLDLESKGNEVFYVAPAFHQTAELNAHYLAGSVVNTSVVFRPSDIGALPDDEEHYVVFNDRPLAYRCSDDPVEVKCRMMKDWIVTDRRQRKPRPLDQEGVIQIADEIADVLRQSRKRFPSGGHKSIDPDDVVRAIQSRPTLETLGFLSRTVLDSELLIIESIKAVPKRIRHRRST